jgi:hypothetical protein
VKKVIITVMAMAATLSVRATLVVDYTVTTSGNVNSRTANSDTVSGDTWNFSDSTMLINTAANANNGKVYGGVITTWSPDKAYAPFVRQTQTNLQVLVSSGAGQNNTCKGMFVWKKEDFINGGSSTQLGFNPGDALLMNMSVTGDTGAGGRSVRFVVEQAGQYYVSQAEWSIAAANLNFGTNATQTTWAPISTSDYSIGTYSALNVTNIQAVGVYFNMVRTGNQAIFNLYDFQVNATAIPEPATLGLLVFSGALIALFRKLHG